MKSTLLRPGLLVSLRTTIKGGVSYQKRTIEPEHAQGAGTVATWETTRQVQDADEHARAVVARGAARTAIIRTCIAGNWLVCPAANEDKLRAGIEEACEIAAKHNETANCTCVEVYAIVASFASDDEQATRAIGSEVRDLIADMERAVRNADPEAIREAANRARTLSGMLGDGTQAKVSAAIAEVRRVARDIVSRVEKAGEVAADVVRDVKLEALAGARFAVLDMLGETEEPMQEVAPVAGRSVDLEPEPLEPLQAWDQQDPNVGTLEPEESTNDAAPVALAAAPAFEF